MIKDPGCAEGLAAIKTLTANGVPTLGTAVYTPLQVGWRRWPGRVRGALRHPAGCPGDGIKTVQELQQLLALHAPQQVLAASFRTPRQALDCLLAGCQSITLPLDVAEQLLQVPAGGRGAGEIRSGLAAGVCLSQLEGRMKGRQAG